MFLLTIYASPTLAEMEGKAPPNLIEKAKEGMEPHHHKETHGRSDDIDASTPISAVKAPNVFERAKEEFEALIETIHPKKDSGGAGRPK